MRLALASVLAAAALFTAPASALIVVDGAIVQSWPDQPRRVTRALPGAQLAEEGLGFYSNPQGLVHGLTLLVDFSDTSPAFSVAEVEAWLNQPGFSEDGLNGSVRDYFFENSNGVVDFQNQVVSFYRASQPKSYYEGGSGYSRAGELVSELMDAVDDEVDFSMFDNDGDGRTEAISIVYAGNAETWGQGLWPHSGGINQMRDGVRVNRYQMTAMETRFVLYTFVHEVGHMLFGWPDLYGFGNYCVMGNASNGANPVGINDFYRADQGWIPVIGVTAQTNRRFYANVNAGGYRYVNPERPEEAFFWSNVQNTDRWSTLRGNGLVVLHFDSDIRTNDPPNPLNLAVVQADGQRELDQTMWPEPGSEQADFYAASGNAELSASTNPSSDWNDDSASGLRLYDVSASGESMTFTVGTGTADPGIGGAGGAAGTGGAGAPPIGGGGSGGDAGMTSSAGTAGSSSAGAGTAGDGGAAGTPGSAGTMTSAGGTNGSAGATALGGSTSTGATGGMLPGTSGAGSNGLAGAPAGGAPSGSAGMPGTAPDATPEDATCGCRLPGTRRPGAPSAYALLVLVMVALRRLGFRRGRDVCNGRRRVTLIGLDGSTLLARGSPPDGPRDARRRGMWRNGDATRRNERR
jgi:M6 family metalloprotease-like protein